MTAVFEEVDGAQVTTWGVGVGIFVHDDFVRELKTPPLFGFSPELTKRKAPFVVVRNRELPLRRRTGRGTIRFSRRRGSDFTGRMRSSPRWIAL